MGHGLIKRRNQIKKEYLAPLRKYAEQLEKENHALKNDPESVVGQFLEQFRELYSQNSRLSVLTATLIKKLGDSVKVTKEEMEAFKGNRINIKWELPEGSMPEDATEYVFTFELQPEPQSQPQQVTPTETPGEYSAESIAVLKAMIPKQQPEPEEKKWPEVTVSGADGSVPPAISEDSLMRR